MKFRHLDLSNNPINLEHKTLGIPPLERSVTTATEHPVLRIAMWLTVFLLLGTLLYLLLRTVSSNGVDGLWALVTATLQNKYFWSAVLIGLIAQIIDGALGMAYGVTSTTFLLASGSSPAVASASVHLAEVFTTGVSGISHVKFGNVNKTLFLKLLVPGIVGAVVGVFLLSSIDGQILKPFISVYLFGMGIYILSKVFKTIKPSKTPPRHVAKLAAFGGFVDTVGGGGWGPVVTTTLIGSGHDPRTTIGTVNFAEFFLTFSSAIAFSLLIGIGPWVVVAGLVLGGLFAAPFAALLCKWLSTKTLLVLVGLLISVVSVFNFLQTFNSSS